MKKNQNQILEMLDFKSIKDNNQIVSIDEKVDNLENIYLKEKEYIENNFKKEKENYLKDAKEKNENISQLKNLIQKLEFKIPNIKIPIISNIEKINTINEIIIEGEVLKIMLNIIL